MLRYDRKMSFYDLCNAIRYPYQGKIVHYEMHFGDLPKGIVKEIADYFGVSVEEVDGYCEIETHNAKGRGFNYEYTLINNNPSKEEIEKCMNELKKYRREKQKKIRYDKKQKIKISKPVHENKVFKHFKCLNQACRLNSSWTGGCNGKSCMCDNPVVVRGDAPCYGRDKVQSKPKREGFDYHNTKNCFMKYTASKEERKKYYAL